QADVTSVGAFYYPMIFDQNSWTGQYKIEGSYKNSNLGSLLLNVISHHVQSNENSVQPNVSIAPTSGPNATLSRQIKTDAKLWSQGLISDDNFVNSLRFLVNIGASEKTIGSQPPLNKSTHI